MSSSQRRAAIVTGAAGGIGSAIAARLDKDGVDVLAVDLETAAAAPRLRRAWHKQARRRQRRGRHAAAASSDRIVHPPRHRISASPMS